MTPTEGEPEQNPVPEEPPPVPPAPQEAPARPTLADRIRAVRDAWKWSQEEMAEVLRVDQASISFWERGKIRPSGSALVALAALFRTTVGALENGEGFVMPSPPGRGTGPKNFRALPRTVCLPVTESGIVAIVDLGDGGLTALQPAEAAMHLERLADGSRSVWIVAE
jgi:transcriptional regulator with XRE-family HTH domain